MIFDNAQKTIWILNSWNFSSGVSGLAYTFTCHNIFLTLGIAIPVVALFLYYIAKFIWLHDRNQYSCCYDYKHTIAFNIGCLRKKKNNCDNCNVSKFKLQPFERRIILGKELVLAREERKYEFFHRI